MEESQIPFSRRVYSGRGVLLDNLLSEVAARPELLRLVSHARDMSDEELETLIGVIGRTNPRGVPGYRWRVHLPRPTLPVTLLAGAGALVAFIGVIGVVLFLIGTVGRAAG
jgi:hypothetical protein